MLPGVKRSRDVAFLQGYRTGGGSGSGSGMNSRSPGTLANRAAFHSALACSIRSMREETKFHQMWRGPSIGSPPSIMKRASVRADRDAVARTENEELCRLEHVARD